MTGTCTAVLSGTMIEVELSRKGLLSETEAGDPDTPLSAEAFEELQSALRGPRQYRLSGIEVPVSVDDAAKSLLGGLLLAKGVRIEVENRRATEGVVWADSGAVCQLALLANGLARISGPHDASWDAVEKQAKKQELGIWGE